MDNFILIAIGAAGGAAIGAVTVAVLVGRWVVRTIEEIAKDR